MSEKELNNYIAGNIEAVDFMSNKASMKVRVITKTFRQNFNCKYVAKQYCRFYLL